MEARKGITVNNIKNVFILSILYLCVSAFGQTRSVKIIDVRVEGNKVAEANVIKLNSGLVAGREISGEDVQNAIKQLWALDMFSDIQILVDKQIGDGIYLAIKVDEYPKLEKIEISGNKKLKNKELEEKLDLYKGQIITPVQINKNVSKLKKLYESKGYLLANIKSETEAVEDGSSVILKFDIEEGEKVRIKKISIHGASAFKESKIKGQFEENKERKWFGIISGEFKKDKYPEDLERVVKFYHNKGFRDAEIAKDSIYYSEDKKDMLIDLWVNEGVKYKFGKITFEGNTLFSDLELRKSLGFDEYDDYNQEKYDLGIREYLSGMYYDKGYIFAQVQPKEIPVGKDTLDLHFNIVEGNSVNVNKIYVSGNTKTKEKVIRRELKLMPGETFSKAKLIRSLREVTILNYFSNVVPDVRPIQGEDKVDIEIKVEEKSTDTANLSAGYSQRDGVIGSVGVSFNNFSITNPLEGGDGQRLGFELQFGAIYRQFSISFTEPWLFDTPTLAGFSFYDTKRRYEVDIRTIGGEIRLGRRLLWPDNYFRVDGIFGVNKDDISGEATGYESFFEDGTQISLTEIISRDSRNHPEFPTEGSVVSWSNELSGGPLSGDFNFTKHVVSIDWYTPLFWKFVFYTNTEFGLIASIDKGGKIGKVRSIEFFRMGGSALGIGTQLRGYDDRTMGPGKTLFKYSSEIRFPIVPNPTVYGLLFTEAGNVWLDMKNTDLFKLNRSAGVGIRLFMPLVGMVGLDTGYGFDDVDGDGKAEGWKFHFQFGRGF
jgi:outer membrane protein insertion porin family